jgi:NAD(P)-dependent dehydrogenase (short-subunit alcohol dehydrogenase family)
MLGTMSFWKDKVALVTGGSSGLGRVIADAFGAAGARVVMAAREPEAVEQAAAEMRAAGCDVLGIHCDITLSGDVDRLFEQTIARYGRLDVLVNNAGRSMRGKIIETTPEQFRDLMELNFFALVRCTQAAVPHLLKQRGHVVNIGSLAAKSGPRWVGAYPATKHAVAAYSQQLRLELGPEGLHVLLVCPGPIARKGGRLYPLEGMEDLPARARAPGAGVRTRPLSPEKVARAILRACQRRQPELVMPWIARLVFALSQLCPRFGDWLVLRQT